MPSASRGGLVMVFIIGIPTILGLGFRALGIRIPIIIPIKRKGSILGGLHYTLSLRTID